MIPALIASATSIILFVITQWILAAHADHQRMQDKLDAYCRRVADIKIKACTPIEFVGLDIKTIEGRRTLASLTHSLMVEVDHLTIECQMHFPILASFTYDFVSAVRAKTSFWSQAVNAHSEVDIHNKTEADDRIVASRNELLDSIKMFAAELTCKPAEVARQALCKYW